MNERDGGVEEESHPKNDALQAEKGQEVCQVKGWGTREAELKQKLAAADEGVTEMKLEESKGMWEGAEAWGNCKLPPLLCSRATCMLHVIKQTDGSYNKSMQQLSRVLIYLPLHWNTLTEADELCV